MARQANADEIARIAKAISARDTAQAALKCTEEFARLQRAEAVYELAIREVREACGALPTQTHFNDETGQWATPAQAQAWQRGEAVPTVVPEPVPFTKRLQKQLAAKPGRSKTA